MASSRKRKSALERHFGPSGDRKRLVGAAFRGGAMQKEKQGDMVALDLPACAVGLVLAPALPLGPAPAPAPALAPVAAASPVDSDRSCSGNLATCGCAVCVAARAAA